MLLSVHPYRLPLTAPLVFAGARQAERMGALLRLESLDGYVGWGDAAPLPGFSVETAAEAAGQLQDLTAWAEHHTFARWDDPALGGLALAASARFALELALLDLAAQRSGHTMVHHLHPRPAAVLPLNALLVLGDDLLADAERLVGAGYRTLKLKVGRRAVADDVDTLRELRRRFPDVALRADANRAWSWDEAARFADAVQPLALEYVEEPLADASLLERLCRETGLPIALDESLAAAAMATDDVPGWTAAVVLKPTLLGGLARSVRLARAAQAVGAQAVWSSAFESGVALRGLVAGAAATGAAPAGLDPYRRLAADVLAPRLPLEWPTVEVENVLGSGYAVVLEAGAG